MINATSDIIDIVSNTQLTTIEALLQTSCFDQDKRDHIESGVANLSPDEANDLIYFLYNNQLDRITSGMNYNQSDIKYHMAKFK